MKFQTQEMTCPCGPGSGPGLAFQSSKVHDDAFDCSCDFPPTNVQTKACFLKLILN